MKDKFFNYLKKIYGFIYKKVTRITYNIKFQKKMTNKCKLTYDEKKQIKDYWKKEYGKMISTREYEWYKLKANNTDCKIIPDVIWHSEIEPYFCNIEFAKPFADKNYCDLLIDKINTPKSIIRCINRQILNENYEPLNENKALELLNKYDEVICKPSIDTGGGRKITFVSSDKYTSNTIKNLIKKYDGNFVIQGVIHQSEFLNQFNKSSVNTIRVVTFLFENKVHILSSFLRIGGENSRLDNVTSGGYFIPIDKNGKLKNSIYTENKRSHDLVKQEKLFNNFNFVNQQIPEWIKIIETLKKYHYRLPHFRLINWDVTLDTKNNPIIIEYNLIDSSASFHQLSNGPIFGELTQSVLNKIKENKNRRG